MRKLLIGAFVAGFALVSAWQGPAPKSSETVARPRKKANPDAPRGAGSGGEAKGRVGL